MYYLSDFSDAEFARKKGSKDKTKRKPMMIGGIDYFSPKYKKVTKLETAGGAGLGALTTGLSAPRGMSNPKARAISVGIGAVGGAAGSVVAQKLGLGYGAAIQRAKDMQVIRKKKK